MSSPCEECGQPLVWGGMSWAPHSDQLHQAKRRAWMRIIHRRLAEEMAFRREGQYAALNDDVLVVWRIVLPTGALFSQSVIPSTAWDQLGREQLLAWLGQGAREHLESSRGIRVHPMMIKYRVFDERWR